MHTINDERISRRSRFAAGTARQLSAVTPCLHTATDRDDRIR